jgi:YVTN family beta-propeller protein
MFPMRSSITVLVMSLVAASTASAQTIVGTVSAGRGPRAVGVNPVTNKTYVGNSDADTVTIVDGATLAATTVSSGGAGPVAIAVNPVSNRIYVANERGNQLEGTPAPDTWGAYRLTIRAANGNTFSVTASGFPAPTFTKSACHRV